MIEKNWKELIKPSKLSVQHDSNDEFKATIVAEPIEKGYGLTIGNSLRRVLLSSLQGAAITAIKIDNVLHEFSSISGVREDVVDIILNIKNIILFTIISESELTGLNEQPRIAILRKIRVARLRNLLAFLLHRYIS